jgi:serine/threonine-protein kinase HipA
MLDATSIEIHREGRWIPAATLNPLGDEHARVDYLPVYIFSDRPTPISLTLPVAFSPVQEAAAARAPAFLYDLVPQGRGRRRLIDLLGLRDHDALVLPLVLAGAFNPIGALRVSSAVDFYRQYARRHPPPPGSAEGFSREELSLRRDNVIEYLSSHAMLAAGTTGVQGVSPKFLLTEDQDGRLHADLAVHDSVAHAHWLVKGPRSAGEADRSVLRNEAAYLRVADTCGLRVHLPAHIAFDRDLLFLRRFDRRVDGKGAQRLHQESLASLAGLRGFGLPCRQNDLLRALRRHVSDPIADTIEFLRRDVLNLAMRNTDNHARNSAVQRLPDGRVQLTPLFDFAPMFIDPEMIPRSTHWADANDVSLHEWQAILPQLGLPDSERDQVLIALRSFAPTVAALPEIMREHGVDPHVIEACRARIDEQVRQLRAL